MDMATKTNHLVVNEEFKENDNQPNLHRVKKIMKELTRVQQPYLSKRLVGTKTRIHRGLPGEKIRTTVIDDK